ncbi:MAG: NfeD family protein [Proteobacteria bacterium]|nr:NfeD family protein [Pseudomonadota bacterium]
MNVETITWIWFIFGIVLIVSEIFIPGLVVVFLGLAAVLVATGRWIGWIEGLVDSFTYWFVISIAVVLSMRGIVSRIKPGEVAPRIEDEDQAAIGRIVDVLDEIGSDHDQGRIRFRGTSWKARTEYGQIFPGHKARIFARQNMVWIVDPVDDEDNDYPFDSFVRKVAEKSEVGRKKERRFRIRKSKRS